MATFSGGAQLVSVNYYQTTVGNAVFSVPAGQWAEAKIIYMNVSSQLSIDEAVATNFFMSTSATQKITCGQYVDPNSANNVTEQTPTTFDLYAGSTLYQTAGDSKLMVKFYKLP